MGDTETLRAHCVVTGGGPAGMMLGFLLARAGVPVVVLEKHADFNRDFRGDTIHPSTLELMHELGLLEEFLKQPHQEVRELRAVVNGQVLPVADFTKLRTANCWCYSIAAITGNVASSSPRADSMRSKPTVCPNFKMTLSALPDFYATEVPNWTTGQRSNC